MYAVAVATFPVNVAFNTKSYVPDLDGSRV